VGKTIDTSTAYSWNITISYDITGKQNQNPSIVYVVPGDVILGISSSITAGVGASRSTPDPYTVWAISLQEGQEGRLLWKKDFAAPSGNLSRTLGPLDPVNRVWTMTDAETMQWLGYSLDTGNLIWGPTTTEVRGMQFFSSGSGAGQRAVTAYGNFYVQGFGGELFCYDASNGNLLWKYNNTNSGIETPWGLMPIFVAAIADGKVYAFNNEHSPNSPLYNGYSIYCINATTGDEIYKMLSWSGQTGGTGTSTAVLADGYLTYYNYYDNSIYCVGKGPSQTTVSASPKVTTYGSSVIVEGTVIDIAAGTKQAEEAARFPNGVPAVSDESMSDWMEYVYMQQAKPLDVKGVTVELYVLDANNNYRSIGTTTTDSSGFYSYQWTPDIEGKYTVYAVFAGSESYYPSQATTAFGVDAVEATPEPTETPPSVADQYFIPAIVGLFILGIITLVLIVLVMLKKKE
ncbi:MAG: PQQ-binding-like beta-propeller repeat protein, partial [Thermoproteota archaeon]|nr:PQQ-binding-like beta-propeller repeat protein [Thermoproteota archaeon]